MNRNARTATADLPSRLLPVLVLLMLAVPAVATVDREAYPTAAPSGLEEKNSREFDILYIKPGFEPGAYGKLIIEEPQVSMDDNWQWNFRHEVSRRDLDRIHGQASAILREQFADKLTGRKGLTLVDAGAAGTGVLRLKPALIDLNLRAPDLAGGQHKDTWVRSAGDATLYLDLYDADSGELLLRAIDRDRARYHERFYQANRATNYRDLSIMVSRWASALRRHLDAMNGGTA